MKNPILATALNIGTLLLGITIGLFIQPILRDVRAQQPKPPEMKIEEIQPSLSSGSAAFGVLLTHQTEADVLVVNGFDILKMQDGILNYLAHRPLAERADIDNIVKNARADTFYKVKEPPKPAPQTEPVPPKAPTSQKETKP